MIPGWLLNCQAGYPAWFIFTLCVYNAPALSGPEFPVSLFNKAGLKQEISA